jgi:lactoylglutathione lyase
MYRLYAIRIFSVKWNESLAFYRDRIGFPVSFADADQGWAQFDLGGCSLGLERCDPDDPETGDLVGRFVGTSIMVDDIEATCDRLRTNGVEFVGPPERQQWGGVLAHFRDPDGNVITLLGNPT